MNTTTLLEQVAELNSALSKHESTLKADIEFTAGPTLVVKDHSGDSEFLTEEAKEVMKKIHKQQYLVENNEVTGKAIYFSLVVKTENLKAGIEELSNTVNKLVSLGCVKAVLAPLSSLALAKVAGRPPISAVFFFPIIDIKKEYLAKSQKYNIEEGNIGEMFGDTHLNLPQGTFWADVQINHFSDLEGRAKLGEYDISGSLINQINEYLKFLPAGTKVLGINKCAIYSLAEPYEVIFYNPILTDVKKVELEWVRHAVVKDDSIHQFNLFTEIKYFDANGNNLFHNIYKK
jgi:hypothetical protein